MISFFSQVDRTSVPQYSDTIEHGLNMIKNSPFGDLITLARKSGKKHPKDGNIWYVDFDANVSTFKHQNIQEQFYKILSQYPDNNIVFWTAKDTILAKKTLDLYKIPYANIITLTNITEYFQDKLDAVFLCVTWHRFDDIKKQKSDGQKGEYKIEIRNLYEYVKCTVLPCVTWNAEFELRRTLKTTKELSGYIYYDVDEFSKFSKEETRNILSDNGLGFVKAIWNSLGEEGLGFLIQVDGLTLDNFKNTWLYYAEKFYNEFNIKVDKATKDISRINVLSYDPNIFIRQNTNALVAINEKKESEVIKAEPISDNLRIEILGQQLDYYYTDKSFRNESEKRMSYHFYQAFFSKTNHLGIALSDVWAYLTQNMDKYPDILNNSKYTTEEIKYVGEKQYNTYSDQFGMIQIDRSQYNINQDYVVTGLYVEYKGDKELKLQDIFNWAVLKETTQNGIVVKLSLRAKRIGITYQSTLSFIERKFSYNPENTVLVKSIYGNQKYPFGLIEVLKDDVIKQKRADIILKETQNGNEVIQNEHFSELEKVKILENILDKLIKFHRKITDKNIIEFLKSWFRETNSYAVSLKEATDFVIKNCEFYAIDRYAKFYGSEVYRYSVVYWGLRIKKAEDKKKITTNISNRLNTSEILPNHQKLSDLDIIISDNQILWADTNMGKTTMICKKTNEKKVILVPTVGALKSIESKYGASAFYEAKKNVSSEDTTIVSTYSSFPILFNIIQSWEGGASKYSLYFDEQHNLAVSAAKDYRNSELNFVLDNMEFFGKRVFMTGTYFPIEHPKIKNLNIQRVKWRSQPQKFAQIVHYQDKYKAVEKLLVRGKKNIIYLQSKKMHRQLGKLVDYLKQCGWSGIYLLNADQKSEPHFQNLINSEYLELDAQVIITTSVAVEAINILDIDVETVHFLTFENPRLMEQMVNRMRKVLPSKIYMYRKEKSISDKTIDITKIQADLIQYAHRMLRYLTIPKQKKKDSYDAVSAQKLFANQIFDKSSLFRVRDGSWEVDYLSIANKVYNEETIIAKNNTEYLKSILSEYGWVFGETIVLEDKMNAKEKETFVLSSEQLKQELCDYSLSVLNIVEQNGIIFLKKEIENKSVFENTKYPDLEWNIRIKVLKLSKYMEFSESCRFVHNWITVLESSEGKFQKSMREIAVQIAKLSKSLESKINLNAKFTQSVISLYLDKKKKYPDNLYTKIEIYEMFNRRKRFHEMLCGLDGEKYALEIFKKYFEIIPVLVDGEIKFKFGGLNPSNDLTIFTKKLYEWADLQHNANISFDSTDLCNILNKFRKNLPILGMFKLNTKQALELLTDYVSVKKTSKRIKGQVQNHYLITELLPQYTKNFIISINQDVIQSTDLNLIQLIKNEHSSVKIPA